MPHPIAPDALNKALPSLKGWQVSGDGLALEKSFQFDDFDRAFDFMTRVADAARTADHHPDWRNVYNRVEFRLSTHDANAITQLDLSLAHAIEAAL